MASLYMTLISKKNKRRTDPAGLARPLRRAEAFKAIFHVDAGPALSTGAGGAFICV